MRRRPAGHICTIRARQGGNAGYNPAPTVNRSFAVAPAATRAHLSGADTGTVGQALTFTATVSVSGGTPGGTVRFRRDGSVFASATLDGAGVAQVTTDDLPEGTHRISVRYIGWDDFTGSVSDGVMVTITVQPPGMQIATGLFHRCSLGTDQRVSCWGGNASGQLGDRTTEDRGRSGPRV